MVFDVGVIIGNNVRPSPITARLAAGLELVVMVSYSPWHLRRLSVASFVETGVCELYFQRPRRKQLFLLF